MSAHHPEISTCRGKCEAPALGGSEVENEKKKEVELSREMRDTCFNLLGHSDDGFLGATAV